LHTPRYCRLTRIIRDIPSNEIEAGNKITNLRQTIEESLKQKGTPCQCIRCREIRNQKIGMNELKLNEAQYKSNVGDEYFLSFDTKIDDKLAGFLRLHLSDKNLNSETIFPELQDAAIIREVHVYGQVVGLGIKTNNKAQHIGLGKKLITKAEEISKQKGFSKIAVISAIGTRGYYAKLGYKLRGLYMLKDL
jgi:elongator complex protein 3